MSTQQGLLGSALVGFGATLKGGRTAPREKWTWTGDLLNIAGGDKLKARFQLVRVNYEGRDQIAYIKGKIISGWGKSTAKNAPETSYELWYSITTKTPLKSRLTYKSATRQQTLETTARWEKIPQKAQLASLKKGASETAKN